MTTENDDLREQARKNVQARNAYKTTLLSWAALAVVLILIWFFTTPGGYFWPIWPILGLVIASITWGFSIYNKSPFRTTNAQIDEEVQRLKDSE